MLVDKANVRRLQASEDNPLEAALRLKPVAVARPLMAASIASEAALAERYREACKNINRQLTSALGGLFGNFAELLKETFASDPSEDWLKMLASRQGDFEKLDRGIQYYYDFLKDVAETYNAFRELVFAQPVWCCPDLKSFPKHLLLGSLASGAGPDENRTAFYPSPLAASTSDELDRGRFLAQKLDAMIRSFAIPQPSESPRITPSQFEDQPLEERAIPFYYAVDGPARLLSKWNYRLTRRRMERSNYSYHGRAYGDPMSAANSPLDFQTGSFSFFRIEGHVGQKLSAALSAIENEITTKNLPFMVRAVLIGEDRGKVAKTPGIRYTDLHRFHYLVRQDVYHQLDDVASFSKDLKDKVHTNDETRADANAQTKASQLHSVITDTAKGLRTRLTQPFSSFKADVAWQGELTSAMRSAADFKFQLGDYIKTDFTTPFDSLAGHTSSRWIDWLGDLIDDKENQETDRQLFKKFLTEHASIEHFAGVCRGGTFVLVYDAANTVVGDFLLPYVCCETMDQEPEQPPLAKPPRLTLPNDGIRLQPPLTKLIKTDLDPRINALSTEFAGRINFVKDFSQAVLTKAGSLPSVTGPLVNEPGLRLQLEKMAKTEQLVIYANEQAQRPDLTAEKRDLYQKLAVDTEAELAIHVKDTTDFVATRNIDVSAGSDAMVALAEVSRTLETIKSEPAVATVKSALAGAQTAATSANVKFVVANLAKGRFQQ